MIRSSSEKRQKKLIKDEQKRRSALHTQVHEYRVRESLIHLGVSKTGLSSEEVRYLPKLIRVDEQIGGVVYGWHQDGFAMLVATDKRVIFLDKKPLFSTVDDIRYEVISGVSFGHVGIGSTVTLHTKIKDYKLRTFNEKCSMGFVQYIESRCLMNGGQFPARQASVYGVD